MTTIIIIVTRPLNPPSNRHTAPHSVTSTSKLCLTVWMPITMKSGGHGDLAVSSQDEEDTSWVVRRLLFFTTVASETQWAIIAVQEKVSVSYVNK